MEVRASRSVGPFERRCLVVSRRSGQAASIVKWPFLENAPFCLGMSPVRPRYWSSREMWSACFYKGSEGSGSFNKEYTGSYWSGKCVCSLITTLIYWSRWNQTCAAFQTDSTVFSNQHCRWVDFTQLLYSAVDCKMQHWPNNSPSHYRLGLLSVFTEAILSNNLPRPDQNSQYKMYRWGEVSPSKKTTERTVVRHADLKA